MNKLIPLECGVQHYAWGETREHGNVPYIADLMALDAPDGTPFAELWIGAHPKLPANAILPDGQTCSLPALVAEQPEEILGKDLVEKGVHSVPFLLKVLSCNQTLSIQAHPDKALAEQLHSRDPEHYPDDNHKPEIAVSLKGLKAFGQFRHVSSIREELERLPPLGKFFRKLPEGLNETAWLKAAYAKLFECKPKDIKGICQALLNYLDLLGEDKWEQTDIWFRKLHSLKGAEPGVLSAYFLNIVDLKPSEALYMGPNEPHAYLEGTIVECMASSDNVVRAGLTGKFVDKEVLLDMLSYQHGEPPYLEPTEMAKGEYCYQPPVNDFELRWYEHDAGDVGIYDAGNMLSLMIVLGGSLTFEFGGTSVKAERGSCWLWPAALETVKVTFDADKTVVVRARPQVQA